MDWIGVLLFVLLFGPMIAMLFVGGCLLAYWAISDILRMLKEDLGE